MRNDAPHILTTAVKTIGNRASQRDYAQQGERSMAATVAAFNALYGTELTEVQGWMFMTFLKAARARQGKMNLDDYVDGSAYFALAGEAAVKADNTKSMDHFLNPDHAQQTEVTAVTLSL